MPAFFWGDLGLFAAESLIARRSARPCRRRHRLPPFRSHLSEDLERRITFPDVIRAIALQTDGVFREDDFKDAFLSFIPVKYCSVTVAYADLGNIANRPHQAGSYVSIQGSW